jgi:hypothetical protein
MIPHAIVRMSIAGQTVSDTLPGCVRYRCGCEVPTIPPLDYWTLCQYHQGAADTAQSIIDRVQAIVDEPQAWDVRIYGAALARTRLIELMET